MSDKLQKKRKAGAPLESRPKKKVQTTSGSAKVQHVSGSSAVRPIVASTSGAIFPEDVKFQAYSRRSTEGPGSQILLHSSDHPTIDFQAGEGSEPGDAHLQHYVAVYDPATNTLKLTEAKRLTLRSSIRQQPRADEDEEEAETQDLAQGTRSALTEAFGSKKSKKAVQAMSENRQLGQGIEGQTIAEAITAHIDPNEDEEDEADATTSRLSNKPIPQPNLQTDDIENVYALSNLIKPSPASNTLRVMPIAPWLASLKSGKEVQSLRSRFVAHRVGYIGKQLLADPAQAQKYTQQLQILRYIELLVQIHMFASKHDRRHRMKFVDQWPPQTISGNVPSHVLREIVKHHFPDNTATTQAMTLLKTTIMALTLHVLPPSGKTGGTSGAGHGSQMIVEPTDIQMDLAVDVSEARKFYHELGCAVKPASEKDLALWGYSKLAKKSAKADMPRPHFAVLKFPLNFPKVSGGRRAGTRR